MKKLDHKVYKKAAQLVANGKYKYSCIAIDKAKYNGKAGLYSKERNTYNIFMSPDENRTLRPSDFFNGFKYKSREEEKRLRALLLDLMVEIVKTGDYETY